eukprot:TRINITY_DN1254_c0_g1_i1.p2 TRINITY_DN1254_c0_g1~~TRINITY_DN1254_c0_g1_i1.p2  ORF type:complete len:164 (-),score=34.95 TRINITY_DN1254_c0_g1_i1:603-1094(-)
MSAKRKHPPDNNSDPEERSPKRSAEEPPTEEDAQPETASRVSRAQFWYYQDTVGNTQGPFYPGQMRDWLDGGYFLETQMVSPSFHGEVPMEYSEIRALWERPESYFMCDETVAFRPPEEFFEPPPEQPEEEEDDEALTRQLKQRLMQRGAGSGPAEKSQSDWR